MSSQPTKVSDLFPSRWLTAQDLQGRSFVLTVKTVTLESLHSTISGEDSLKIVLTFDRGTKEMALNKTQSLKMAELTGTEEFSRWVGARVQIRPGKMKGKDTIIISPPPAENAP